MARLTEEQWGKIEIEYRAGKRALRDIGAEYGVSHTSIQKKADKEGWTRDLSARIAAAAEEKVAKAEVSKAVAKEQKVTERVMVETAAQMMADAVLNQRQDVRRARGLLNKMFAEAELQQDGLAELEQLAEILSKSEEAGITERMETLFRRVLDFPSRVDSVKKLVEALKSAIDLERKVLRIKDDDPLADAATKFGEGVAMSAAEAYKRMIGG